MRWILLFVCVLMAGCATRYDADVAQSNAQAQAAQAQAAQVEAVTGALETVARTQSNTVPAWLVVVLLLVVAVPVCVYLWWRGRIQYVREVAQVQGQAPVRLLPGQPGYYAALRQVARDSGAEVQVAGGSYYLVTEDDVTEVRGLLRG